MSNPLDPLKSATNDGDVMTKIDQAAGTYKDAAAEGTDQESKLGTASMPKAPDPSPFVLGPLTTGGGR